MRMRAPLCLQTASMHMCMYVITVMLRFSYSLFPHSCRQLTRICTSIYSATEDYFGDEKDQSFVFTVYFKMFCESSEIFSRILFLYICYCMY